ncbi:MAG: hypothetical protein LBK61_05080 [Spirochaetaceae bacterium]|nr:hypothetical protein [Spirochaetaceae bacterium]
MRKTPCLGHIHPLGCVEVRKGSQIAPIGVADLLQEGREAAEPPTSLSFRRGRKCARMKSLLYPLVFYKEKHYNHAKIFRRFRRVFAGVAQNSSASTGMSNRGVCGAKNASNLKKLRNVKLLTFLLVVDTTAANA